MTDYKMEEIYGLSRKHSKVANDKIQLQAFPFRMTTQNLARYADDPNAPFGKCSKWEAMRSLQQGDHRRLLFAISTMCSIRGVTVTDLDPSAPCPPEITSTPVAAALQSPC